METPLGFKIIDNAFNDSESVINWLNESEWNRSTYGAGEVGDLRTSSTRFVEMFNWHNPSFIHEMNKTVWLALDQYAKDWEFTFHNVEGPSIQKYEKGEEYKVHADHGPGYIRICSALLYLNEEFEGGQTHFPHINFSITPKRGRLVIFPSNYIYAHASLPILSGTKYAAAFWANG